MFQSRIADRVSTHSRPKAAGFSPRPSASQRVVSTHSRPKAAGFLPDNGVCPAPSFNTQPPEGGWGDMSNNQLIIVNVSTHSRPKAAGTMTLGQVEQVEFQHTAARRRLGLDILCFR